MRICEADNCHYPVFGTDKNSRKGYCRSHQHLRTDIDRRTPYQKAIDKEKPPHRQSKPFDFKIVDATTKIEMDLWFIARWREFTGRCIICGGKTCTSAKDYKKSAAHLLAKRKSMFPSVATHEDNFIELCFYGNSCHTNFDNNILTLESIKTTNPTAWKIITDKFKKIFPYIAEQEKKNLPQLLLNELNHHQDYHGYDLTTKEQNVSGTTT